MRPLFHPAIEDVSPEAILHALSDPNRAAILVNIMQEGGIEACSTVAALGNRVIPKSSLSNHFKILREAGLIRSERHGVELRNHLRLAEVNARFPGLLSAIMNAYALHGDGGGRTSTTSRRSSPRGGAAPTDPPTDATNERRGS